MFSEFAALPASIHIGTAFVFGLLVGSFLNVVVYRLPKMMQYAWTAQSHEWLNNEPYPQAAPAGIIKPASHCGKCGVSIKPWHNIPILAFIFLKGRCANCKVWIGWRYPLVELLTGVLSGLVVWHFGWSSQALFALILTWTLVCLSFIDYDHKLLPDDIVLPTLWLGLILSLGNTFTNPTDSIIGAVAGYMSLWLVFQTFKLATGKEGMGHGDFKLLALFGAWLGWQFLPQILLVSTVVGSVVGVGLILMKKNTKEQAIPFGPFIAIAGWLALIFGDMINASYLSYTGLG